MQQLGPLPLHPIVTVAVSGGPDSLALTLLAARWCQRQNIRLLALIVDHKLRSSSTSEANTVAGWLRSRGIEHRILTWTHDAQLHGSRADGSRLVPALQARARTERYRLLTEGARQAGAITLLLGHTADDQLETTAMRSTRQEDGDGLAGMAAVQPRGDVLVCRPLLSFARARVQATAPAFGLTPLQDPSNRDHRFERVRVRAALAHAPEQRSALKDKAHRVSADRRRREQAVAELFAASALLHREGYATVDRSALSAADWQTAAGLTSALLASVGGARYPADRSAVDALLMWCGEAEVTGASQRTLAGCVIRRRRHHLLIARELAGVAASTPAGSLTNTELRWDGRWRITPPIQANMERWAVKPLGAVDKDRLPRALQALPMIVRSTLPTLVDQHGVHLLPLFLSTATWPTGSFVTQFAPVHPVARGPFAVVSDKVALI